MIKHLDFLPEWKYSRADGCDVKTGRMLPPNNVELMAKINEIINYINALPAPPGSAQQEDAQQRRMENE